MRNLEQESTSQSIKRDLTLKKKLDESKGLIEARQHSCLIKDNSEFIADMGTSKIQTVDSLRKVHEILREISKLIGTPVNEWTKLDVILKWSRLSNDEKNRYYSDLMSHELNVFLKFKDTEYFESTVRGILSNKMEKSFIDFYVLDKFDEIVEFARPDKFKELNALEVCFLIDALVKQSAKTGDSSFKVKGESIAKTMRLECEAQYLKSQNKS